MERNKDTKEKEEGLEKAGIKTRSYHFLREPVPDFMKDSPRKLAEWVDGLDFLSEEVRSTITRKIHQLDDKED